VAWGLEHISSAELTDWSAYLDIEPAGDERGDYQAAVIASTIANVFRNEDKKNDPYTMGDFMLSFAPKEPEVKPDWHQQLAQVELINIALGGVDLRSNHG
jgi:hypothetical protein